MLRARLDQWLADKVAEKGAMVVPNMKVDELLRKDGRVIGIRAGDDEIGAGVVIVAEGVLRLCSAARRAWRPSRSPQHHALGYKEVIELPAGVIEDRWRLNPGEGAAQLFMGDVTRGMMGGGFLYTNKESISLGVVVGMDAMLKRRSPRWSPGGCSTSSRSSRTSSRWSPAARWPSTRRTRIPRAASRQVPRLAGDGYVVAGDAAGLSLNALVTVRGMDFAIASGYYAARAILKAREAGDFSAAGLASYEASLRDSFVLKDLETARAIPAFMENERLFTHYPGGRLAPARADLHGRAGPDRRSGEDGLEGRAPRVPERADAQGRLVGAPHLAGR